MVKVGDNPNLVTGEELGMQRFCTKTVKPRSLKNKNLRGGGMWTASLYRSWRGKDNFYFFTRDVGAFSNI